MKQSERNCMPNLWNMLDPFISVIRKSQTQEKFQISGIDCMKLCTRTVHFVLHHSNVIRIFHTQILLYWSVSVWMMAVAAQRCSILGNFYFAGISAKNFDGHLFEKLAFVTEPNIIVMQDFCLKSIIILSRFTQKMIFT